MARPVLVWKAGARRPEVEEALELESFKLTKLTKPYIPVNLVGPQVSLPLWWVLTSRESQTERCTRVNWFWCGVVRQSVEKNRRCGGVEGWPGQRWSSASQRSVLSRAASSRRHEQVVPMTLGPWPQPSFFVICQVSRFVRPVGLQIFQDEESFHSAGRENGLSVMRNGMYIFKTHQTGN